MNESAPLILSRQELDDLALMVKKLAWAYILIHADLNLGTINLLPAWIGYCIILSCLPVLTRHAPSNRQLNVFCGILIFYELITWLMTCFGYAPQTPAAMILQLIFGFISIYFHFQLLTSLLTVAGQLGSQYCITLRHLRNGVTVLHTVAVLYMPLLWDALSLITILLILVNLVLIVFIIVILFRLHREISDMTPQ